MKNKTVANSTNCCFANASRTSAVSFGFFCNFSHPSELRKKFWKNMKYWVEWGLIFLIIVQLPSTILNLECEHIGGGNDFILRFDFFRYYKSMLGTWEENKEWKAYTVVNFNLLEKWWGDVMWLRLLRVEHFKTHFSMFLDFKVLLL